MRRGYWTGFIVGGLLGMVAARAYGDRLMESMFPGMVGAGRDDSLETEGSSSSSFRPRRRRRFKRDF